MFPFGTITQGSSSSCICSVSGACRGWRQRHAAESQLHVLAVVNLDMCHVDPGKPAMRVTGFTCATMALKTGDFLFPKS